MKDVFIAALELLQHGPVPAERLDDFLAADRLLHHPVEFAEIFLEIPEAAARISGDKIGEQKHQRNNEKGNEGEPEVQQKHRDHDPQKRKNACEKGRDVLRNSLIHRIDVIRQAAHQFTRRVVVEETQRKLLHMREEIAAQPFQRPLRYIGHHPDRNAVEQVFEDIGGKHHGGYCRQAGSFLDGDETINCDPHEIRAYQTQNRIDDDHRADGD